MFAFDHPGLRVVAFIAAAAVMLPIAALIVLALSGADADWAHIINNVLPGALQTTIGLMVGVAVLTAAMGITTAWLTVHHDFPGRRVFAWALVLPLAVPPYLAAYSYAEFLHYTGPVQGLIRAIFGFTSRRDYWFPDVRSLGGTIFVMSCVLYPYVYLATRATFLMQGRNAADVARTLGASPAGALFRVILPMARPAIVVGISLALMETLNDVGAVEFLGVRTLSSAVYTTWLNQGSLSGAAQIAIVMLLVVFAVVMGERWARRRQRFTTGRGTAMVQRHSRVPLSGWRGLAASLLCAVIIVLGFGISFFVLGGYAMKRLDQLADPVLQSAILTSVTVAALAAIITVVIAFLIAYAVRVTRSPRLVIA
ncbi:MAG: ABC transporter permease, partial [Parvibaculaceae bacterium]